jgi:O-antigen ligase
MPTISLISYFSSDLSTLTPSLLEADLRWLLATPIIITMRDTQISKHWLLAALCAYAISSFSSSFIETLYLSDMRIRANGDENAVPFGMFNATICLMILTFCLYIHQQKTTNPTLLAIVALTALLALCATLLTKTRAAVILLPIGAFILILLFYKFKAALIALLFVLSSLPFLDLKSNQQAKQIYTEINSVLTNKEEMGSLGERAKQWKEAWCIYKLNPLSGSGPRSFKHAHQKYGEQCNSTQTLKQGSYQAHSVYFNTLATQGTLGIIGLAGLLITLIYIALSNKQNKLGSNLLLIVICCHLVNGITLDLWFRNHIMDKNLTVLILPLLILFQNKKLTKP